MPGGLIALVVAIVIISAVVGLIAQFLNKLNEMNAPPARRPNGAGRANGVPARPPSADKDMDRFLAEIDRLRRRNTDAAGPAAPAKPAGRPAVAAPVARPAAPPRPRVIAELAEPRPRPEPTARRGVDRVAMPAPPAAVVPGSLSPEGRARPEDLPVASVVTPILSTGARATGVTRFAGRPRPAAKTPLGKDLTALLGSANGVATAVILQEVLGPPKSRRR